METKSTTDHFEMNGDDVLSDNESILLRRVTALIVSQHGSLTKTVIAELEKQSQEIKRLEGMVMKLEANLSGVLPSKGKKFVEKVVNWSTPPSCSSVGASPANDNLPYKGSLCKEHVTESDLKWMSEDLSDDLAADILSTGLVNEMASCAWKLPEKFDTEDSAGAGFFEDTW